MKNLQHASLLLLLSIFCAQRANAWSGGPTDLDSTAQSLNASAGSGAAYLGGTTNYYFIPIDSANKMLDSYLSSIDAETDSTNVQSFIMDADAIRTYLSDNSIKKVKVMFAHTLNYINSGHAGMPCGYKAGKLTIIMAGFDSSGNYIFTPDNKVPDRAEPCPTKCPVSGTAADMILH